MCRNFSAKKNNLKNSQFKSICEICALPTEESPCSQRCRRLAPKKRSLNLQAEKARQLVQEAIRRLAADTTQCPGVLAHEIVDQLGIETASARDSLTLLRGIYLELREAKKIRFFQKGKVVPLGKELKGPFRIGSSSK